MSYYDMDCSRLLLALRKVSRYQRIDNAMDKKVRKDNQLPTQNYSENYILNNAKPTSN
jgi:hypothetical protein